MALAASWTHGNVTELESHPSVTKTPRGCGAEFSFPKSGTVNSQTFETGAATAASSQVLWLPVVLFLTLWIKIASPGPHCFSAESASAIAENASRSQMQDNEDERRDAGP
jgi:hypothetical protein